MNVKTIGDIISMKVIYLLLNSAEFQSLPDSFKIITSHYAWLYSSDDGKKKKNERKIKKKKKNQWKRNKHEWDRCERKKNKPHDMYNSHTMSVVSWKKK